MTVTEAVRRQIDSLISTHRVVLFMKGTRRAPSCGFSASVVEMLDELLPTYETVDVLASPEIREGIKDYSEWPTLPQLYVDGRFVGGADIIREMHATGELAKTLGVSAEIESPAITISEPALKALRSALEGDGDALHFEVDARFSPSLFFGPRERDEVEVVASGLTLLMKRSSLRRANRVSIDFVDGPEGGGFKIENPNEPPKVKQISARELATMIARKETFELFDVRTDAERAIASIPGHKVIDERSGESIDALDRATPLVFYCHHGMRSQAAAEHFLTLGFTRVMNVRGGIDAWSVEVDPSVRRY